MLSSGWLILALVVAACGGDDSQPSGSASGEQRQLAPTVPYLSLRDGAYYDYPHHYHLYDYGFGFESLPPVPLVDDPFAYYGSNRNPRPPYGNTGLATSVNGL